MAQGAGFRRSDLQRHTVFSERRTFRPDKSNAARRRFCFLKYCRRHLARFENGFWTLYRNLHRLTVRSGFPSIHRQTTRLFKRRPISKIVSRCRGAKPDAKRPPKIARSLEILPCTARGSQLSTLNYELSPQGLAAARCEDERQTRRVPSQQRFPQHVVPRNARRGERRAHRQGRRTDRV